MKYLFLLFLLIISYTINAQQIGGGLKFGIDQTYDLKLTPTFKSNTELVLMNLSPKFEGHLGVWMRASSEYFFFQTELLLHKTDERYLLGKLGRNTTQIKFSEHRYFLELPLIVGSTYRSLEFYTGVAPRVSINTPQNLAYWFDLQRCNEPLYLKYMVGVGLKLGSLRVDLRYNNQLLSYHDCITVDNHAFQAVDHIERISIGVTLDFLY